MSSDESAGLAAGENVVALLPWDLTVRRALSRRRAAEILDRKDADEALRALSELEAYYLVKELGIEGSLSILTSLEPHHIRALVDLDVWHGGQPSLDDLLLWLDALREGGIEPLARAARALDPELLALLFRRRLHVALAPRGDDASDEEGPVPDWLQSPPEEILPLIETPDRRFVIAARVRDEEDETGRDLEEESRKLILELVDLLYKDADLDVVVGALRTAHDDLSSVLEESALQYRDARMEDLGFPELSRAIELYAPLDPKEVFGSRPKKLPIPDLVLPALYAGRLSHGLFREALERVESVEVVRRLEGELVALANTAAVADRVEPGNIEQLGEVLERVRAYIELALGFEAGSEDPLEVARARLEIQPMRALFRVGFGLTLDLAHRARRIIKTGAFALGGDPSALLGEEDAAVLRAVDARRPRYPAVLDGEAAEARRAFRSGADLERVASRLGELEALAEVAAKLGLARENAALQGLLDPPLPEERDIDMLIATSAANALLGRGFVVSPLDTAALSTLAEELSHPPAPALERVLSAYTLRAGAAASPALEARTRRGLDALRETLSAVGRGGGLDARFVGVVVREVR